MSYRIRIDHGQHAGRVYRLAGNGVYVLGRMPDSSIQVLDMKVSKEHCTITVRGEGAAAKVVLADLDSRHGTLVNGQPVSGKVNLKPGDEIRLGLTILRVLSDGEADVEAQSKGATALDEASAQDVVAGTPAKRRKVLPPDELVGTDIAGYKVKEKIGQGGMGSVYVAEQLSLHREVALKVLSHKFTSDSNFVDQFVNEARSAAALNHPNVVQVYDVGRQDGRYYFSMEFVPGGSLEEHLAEKGPADWRAALNWMIDASNALIFAQKREILHRDVKPDNLMLAEDGSAKLCDLGLAKKAANPDMLAAGIIGTPAFISPEAIRRKKEIDVRSDLYSLGCAFYRILTGENPYPGKTVKEILLGHLNQPVPRVSAKKPNVAKGMDDIVFRLMQKEPDDRFQNPQELFHALDRIRIEHGLEAHGIRPPSKKWLVAAGVAVVVAAAVLVYALTRPDTVITKDDIEAQKAAERARKEAAEQAARAFVSDRQREIAEYQVQKAQGQLRADDNWSDPRWLPLADKFEALAERLAARPDYKDVEELQDIARTAREDAEDIRSFVELRRSVDATIRTAQDQDVEAITKAIEGRKREFDEALAKGDYVRAAQLANPEELDKLLAPYRAKTVGDILPAGTPKETREKLGADLLLSPGKHIDPEVSSSFPGDPPGQALLDRAVQEAQAAWTKALTEVSAKADPKTHEAYAEAVAAAEALLETIPVTVPRDAGPRLSELAPQLRQRVSKLKLEMTMADRHLLAMDILQDKTAWFTLLRTVRAPGGLLYQFRVTEALETARKTAATMRFPGYARLAQACVGDLEALDALLKQMVETAAAGWVKDRVLYTDERGKEDLVKVKDVTEQGLKVGNDSRTFAQLGPGFVLKRLVYVDPGETRFEIQGPLHRGVAFLAELAVDYDLAQKHYEAYLTQLDPDDTATQGALRRRLGQLPRERKVGEAWKKATDNQAWLRAFADAHDPALVGEEEFWDRGQLRDELKAQEERQKRARLFDEAWRAIEVLNDESLADTVWGTVIRSAPVTGVRYADEPEVELSGPIRVVPPDPPKDDGSAEGSPPPPDDGSAPPPDEGAQPPDEGSAPPPDEGAPPPEDGPKPPEDGTPPPEDAPKPPEDGSGAPEDGGG